MKKFPVIDKIVFFLLLFAGLNWGLVGLFNLDLVGAIFGSMPMLAMLIYILMGLAAVYRFVMWARVQSGK